MKKESSWYRKAFCKLHFDMHTPDTVTNIAVDFDPDEFIRLLKIASPDAICFFAKSAIGWSHYPTKIGAIHPHLKRDLLGEALDACHRNGIKLIAYYCIEVLPSPIAEKHPEYLLRNKEGKPFQEHGERATACLNSPVQQEHILPLSNFKKMLSTFPSPRPSPKNGRGDLLFLLPS